MLAARCATRAVSCCTTFSQHIARIKSLQTIARMCGSLQTGPIEPIALAHLAVVPAAMLCADGVSNYVACPAGLQLKKALEAVLAQPGARKPTSARFFRGQMQVRGWLCHPSGWARHVVGRILPAVASCGCLCMAGASRSSDLPPDPPTCRRSSAGR